MRKQEEFEWLMMTLYMFINNIGLSNSNLLNMVTVNHDVAGSSPAGGAKKEAECNSTPFSFFVSRIAQVRRVSLCETLHGLLARRCERPAGDCKIL